MRGISADWHRAKCNLRSRSRSGRGGHPNWRVGTTAREPGLPEAYAARDLIDPDGITGPSRIAWDLPGGRVPDAGAHAGVIVWLSDTLVRFLVTSERPGPVRTRAASIFG